MTLTTTSRVAIYQGNGVTTIFPFNFIIPSASNLTVSLQDFTTGEIIEVLSPGSYTVAGFDDPAGGTVTYNPGTPLSADFNIIILRTMPYTQDMNIENQGGFLPEVVEQQLDFIVMQIQQLAELQSRSITVNPGETPPSVAQVIDAEEFAEQAEASAAAAAASAASAAQFVNPTAYGAIPGGTFDNAIALQLALDTGKLVFLDPSLTYAFGSQLIIPSGGGFVGGGKLKMLTGAGKFDAADYTGGRATNKVGILLDGKTNVTVEAIIEMEANASIRTCNPISVVSSTNIHINAEVSGFKEAQYALVSWDTNVGGFVKLYAHDCNPDSDTLASMQLTALCVDADRVSSINSVGLVFDAIVKNVQLVDAAAIQYGYQSDAVNIQSQGYSGITGRVYADTVGEALDCFGDGNNITVVARNVYAYGVKLIHGAENNLIFATVDNTHLNAVVLGGSNTSTKTVSHNRIYATARRVGEINPVANIAAVATDGTSATYKPEKNYVEITAFGDGVNMAWVVAEDSGSNNVFVADGDGWATNFARIAGTAGTGNNRSIIRRTRRSRVRASVGTATTITTGSVVPYDTEALDTNTEYNPATGTFTAKSPCRINVKAQLRSGGIDSLATFTLIIKKNSTDIARISSNNYAASTQEAAVQVSATLDIDSGDAVSVGFISSQAGSIPITNSAEYSFLEIEEI